MRRIVALLALACAGCAPALMKLPSSPAAPASDGRDAVADATSACQRVTSMTAELAVTGSVGGQRIRGRMIVGVARPGSVRIEAAAPFGAPLFIFVARGGEATLLLPRDDRILEHGKPADVLEAIAGVPLDPVDLRAVLTGCAVAPDAAEAQQSGSDWRIVPDGQGRIYLHRDSASAPWRLAAATRPPSGSADGWRAEYRNFQDGLPHEVRLTSAMPRRFDLRVTLAQVETNMVLGPEAFQIEVPRTARPITLDELRESGPLSPRDHPESDRR